MSSIRIKRGTRAQIEAAAAEDGLRLGEPYLMTDEDRVVVGTGTGAFSESATAEEVSVAQSDIDRINMQIWMGF